MAQTIREFQVGIGFNVNKSSIRQAQQALAGIETKVTQLKKTVAAKVGVNIDPASIKPATTAVKSFAESYKDLQDALAKQTNININDVGLKRFQVGVLAVSGKLGLFRKEVAEVQKAIDKLINTKFETEDLDKFSKSVGGAFGGGGIGGKLTGFGSGITAAATVAVKAFDKVVTEGERMFHWSRQAKMSPADLRPYIASLDAIGISAGTAAENAQNLQDAMIEGRGTVQAQVRGLTKYAGELKNAAQVEDQLVAYYRREAAKGENFEATARAQIRNISGANLGIIAARAREPEKYAAGAAAKEKERTRLEKPERYEQALEQRLATDELVKDANQKVADAMGNVIPVVTHFMEALHDSIEGVNRWWKSLPQGVQTTGEVAGIGIGAVGIGAGVGFAIKKSLEYAGKLFSGGGPSAGPTAGPGAVSPTARPGAVAPTAGPGAVAPTAARPGVPGVGGARGMATAFNWLQLAIDAVGKAREDPESLRLGSEANKKKQEEANEWFKSLFGFGKDKAKEEKRVEGEEKVGAQLAPIKGPSEVRVDPMQLMNDWLRGTAGLIPAVRVTDRTGKDIFEIDKKTGDAGFAKKAEAPGTPTAPGGGPAPGTAPGGPSAGTGTQLPGTAQPGVVAGGGAFTKALEKLESDFSNNPPPINDKNARAGTPSKGFFQIIDPTWRRYAPKDVLEKYPSADLAPHDVQEAVARKIPLNQFGPRTVAGLQKQFGGKLDTSKTIGELADATGGGAPGVASTAPGGGGVAPTPGGGTVTVDPGKARGVSPELVSAQKSGMEAALPPGYSATMTSGKREGNRGSQHFTGNAADWQIKGPDDKIIANRGNDPTGIYHKFQVETLAKLYRDNPDLAKWYASGEYFETEKGSGLRDPMHGDFGGPRATPGYGDPQAIHREAKRLNEQRQQVAQAAPKLQYGGFVSRTGLALVHQGEQVIPPSVSMPGPVMPSMNNTYNSGGNRNATLNQTTNITVSNDQTTSVSDLDQLMRRHNADMVRNLGGAIV